MPDCVRGRVVARVLQTPSTCPFMVILGLLYHFVYHNMIIYMSCKVDICMSYGQQSSFKRQNVQPVLGGNPEMLWLPYTCSRLGLPWISALNLWIEWPASPPFRQRLPRWIPTVLRPSSKNSTTVDCVEFRLSKQTTFWDLQTSNIIFQLHVQSI